MTPCDVDETAQILCHVAKEVARILELFIKGEMDNKVIASTAILVLRKAIKEYEEAQK